ncbi:hypothetical protein NB069_08795 [Leclercia adecarboxylata]|uniref:hypothetical protein n=1 Tax=Leclercia adecarboxylata TaxID=83655 RepID=UPI002029E8F0|nr:hypothetical protein [Leclercia adecarboxylata]URO00946.1 hypothetical protein NB069_08795 [Leclercia adecarboxylata]
MDVIGSIAKKASDIADLAGAMPDKLAMNERFLSEFHAVRDGLKAKENALFGGIAKKIPVRQRVEMPGTLHYLAEKAKDLGGVEHLSPVEKRVLHAISKDEAGELPTFARVENERKKVGATLKNTLFGSAEEYDLETLYDHLKNDKGKIAQDVGLGDQLKQANALTRQRKTLEESVKRLLGKDMSGDLMYQARKAMDSLMKGDTKTFRKLLAAIPDKKMRRDIFATALRDAFRTGSKTEGEFNLPGFVKFFSGLQRNGTIRLLAEELGPDTMRQLGDLYVLSQAVNSARRYHVSTGKLATFLDKFDKPEGFVYKLKKHGKRTALGYAVAHIPIVGPVVAPAVITTAAARDAAKPTGADAVATLMNSPIWRRAVEGAKAPEANQDVIVRDLEQKVSKLDAWKEFFRELPADDKRAIARSGIIAWLSGASDEE